ncbi:MAG: response regulator, partial [Termitinemataceae bacterium]
KPVKRRELREALETALITQLDLDADTDTEMQEAVPTREKLDTVEIIHENPINQSYRTNASILIVEDHPVNQQLFVTILEKLGFKKLYTADDGLDALEKISESTIDLVFMDIQMPRMNGYEATQQLRQRGFTKPIIAVTASALADEREQCLQSGMNDILIKPYKRTDIETICKKWLQLHTESKSESMGSKALVEDTLEEVVDEEAEELGEELGELESIEEGKNKNTDTEILNEAQLLENFFGNRETVVSLLQRFMERTEASLAALPGLIDQEDWESARREAHTIKGSSLNLAAADLGQAAARVELDCKEQRREDLLGAMNQLREAYARFKKAAQRIQP